MNMSIIFWGSIKDNQRGFFKEVYRQAGKKNQPELFKYILGDL